MKNLSIVTMATVIHVTQSSERVSVVGVVSKRERGRDASPQLHIQIDQKFGCSILFVVNGDSLFVTVTVEQDGPLSFLRRAALSFCGARHSRRRSTFQCDDFIGHGVSRTDTFMAELRFAWIFLSSKQADVGKNTSHEEPAADCEQMGELLRQKEMSYHLSDMLIYVVK